MQNGRAGRSDREKRGEGRAGEGREMRGGSGVGGGVMELT